jgi:hypothetical protein
MNTASSNKSGCLGLFLQMFGIAPSTSIATTLPFRLRDDFLSPAEISFYHVLLSIVGDKFTVCPKVNLNDIFFVSRPDQNQAARNRISSKHVDFLLCDSRSMRPRVGIELDDASHAREDRQTRDALVQQVFDAAGLPLLHFPVQRAYNISEITSSLSAFLGEAAILPALPIMQDTGSAPLCPKCGVPLVIRSGKRGTFYGCSNFPKCREIVSIP